MTATKATSPRPGRAESQKEFSGATAAAVHADFMAWYRANVYDVRNVKPKGVKRPEALTRKANDRLYDLAGLRAAYAALRPRGLLAAWSAGQDRNFTRRLRKAGSRLSKPG